MISLTFVGTATNGVIVVGSGAAVMTMAGLDDPVTNA